MNNWNKKIKYSLVIAVCALVISLFVFFSVPMNKPFHSKDMHGKRTEFIAHKNAIISSLIPQGKYRCCLEKPCTYCIEKDPKHGEGATCDCLNDIVNGVHPCGECIGEIMEGHGNRYLSKYFANAIAEEMGEQHKPALKQMMKEKYGIPIREQI